MIPSEDGCANSSQGFKANRGATANSVPTGNGMRRYAPDFIIHPGRRCKANPKHPNRTFATGADSESFLRPAEG
jgi:hypothetical protein